MGRSSVKAWLFLGGIMVVVALFGNGEMARAAACFLYVLGWTILTSAWR